MFACPCDFTDLNENTRKTLRVLVVKCFMFVKVSEKGAFEKKRKSIEKILVIKYMGHLQQNSISLTCSMWYSR